MLKRLFILCTLFILTGCPPLEQRWANIEQDKLNQATVIDGINNISDSLEQISAKFDEYSYRLKSVNDRLDSLELAVADLKTLSATLQKLEEEANLKDERRGDDFSNEIVSIKADLAEISVKLMALQKELQASSPKEPPKPVEKPAEKPVEKPAKKPIEKPIETPKTKNIP